ncbi:MAG: hypothetical protein KDK07_22340 [Bauldia sp.]|nr:hypothetical protein [Bauldia sp.]
MLGRLIASLDDPAVAPALLGVLNDAALSARLAAAVDATGEPPAEVLASAIHGFIETASDDLWTQLIGIMNRADDPGLAAVRAILGKVLPAVPEAGE